MIRRVENRRLVYYGEVADQAFWERRWERRISEDEYRGALAGKLGIVEDAIVPYLPREGRILEAGCGTGRIVVALRARGYACEGTEWATQTVERVLQVFPDLPVQVGDVTALDAPDGLYAGYISLGVMEHRRDGPGPFLEEAFRVLAPGGVMLTSVPFFSPLRRASAVVGRYRGQSVSANSFYQYAFTTREFADLICAAGFVVETVTGYDPVHGIRSESSLATRLFQAGRLGTKMRVFCRRNRFMVRVASHMRMFVCRKPVV